MSTTHASLCFCDAYDLGVAFLQGHGQEASSEIVRRCVQEAHLDIINAYDWPSLEGAGRIHLHAAQSTGTVSYDHSTRRLTITGAVWPDWVLDGSVLLDGIVCEIESAVAPVLPATDTTVIVLHESLNPGANLAAGTDYILFCRWHPLPADFVNFTGPMGRNSWAYGQPISMPEMAGYHANQWTTGTIRYYSIGERPNRPGEKALFVWPFSDASEPLDFTYQRRPRELTYTGKDAADCVGTITIASGGTAIAGSSTAFESGMVGSMLLIGRDGSSLPTGRYGLNRFSEQLRIGSVTSATAAAATSAATSAHSAVKYVVTDPIDVETCAQNAFFRYVEMHLAMATGLDRNSVHGGYSGNFLAIAEKALRDAMAASYPIRYEPGRYSAYREWTTGSVDLTVYGG